MRVAISVVLSLLFVGCASDRTLGPGDLLLGRWGADGAVLQASPTNVAVLIRCEGLVTGAPIRVGSDRTFAAAGTLTGPDDRQQSVALNGRILAAGIIELEVGAPFSQTFTLRQGAQPDLGNAVCALGG